MIDKVIFECSRSERFLSFVQILADLQKAASEHILDNKLCKKELTEKLSDLNILMTHMTNIGDINLDEVNCKANKTLEELNIKPSVKKEIIEAKKCFLHLVN